MRNGPEKQEEYAEGNRQERCEMVSREVVRRLLGVLP